VRVVIVGALLVLAGLGIAAPAAGEATVDRVVFTLQVDDVFPVQECTGEPVRVQGEVTSILRSTVDATGALRSGGHTEGHLIGTGLVTGDTYRVITIREITTNLAFEGEGAIVVGTGAWAFLVVGPGPDNNFLVFNQEHFTVTPSGDVVVNFRNITSVCR
jgi:hypothetical protein